MLFRQVIGQAAVKNRLLQMVHQNRLGHALLFLGKEGSGALPLAMSLAQFLVCEKVNNRALSASTSSLFEQEPPESASTVHPAQDACGECPACIRAKQMIHPDIHFSYPVVPRKPGDKPLSTDYAAEWREFFLENPYGNCYDWLQFINAENRQGNITAYECSDIIRKLSLKSFESEYKILIMWMPEYLGNEGNKLLKLVEEPPANTLFILVAENESLILPTIVSRTLLVKIPQLGADEIETALIHSAGANAEQARRLSSVCEGNYREALQLLKHSDEDWHGLLRDWLNAILKTGPIAQVKWIEEISKLGREKQKQFLRYFNHLLEQSIRLRHMAGYQKLMPGTELDFAERLNKITTLAQQNAIIGELDRASYHIERNASPKMLFHALTIKLYHIIANMETAEMS